MPILPLASRKLRRHVKAARALVYVLILLLTLAASLVVFAGGETPNAFQEQDKTAVEAGQRAISLVSINGAGSGSGNGASQLTAVSANGRFVVFTSSATNLVPGIIDTNNAPDVFVRDRLLGITALATVRPNSNSTGNGASGAIGPGSTVGISADGRWVVYASQASDLGPLVDSDTNGVADVFLYDREGGTNRIVSAKNDDFRATGNGGSSHPVISANGQVVVFISAATDLSPTSDANAKTDVYARHILTTVTELVSVNTAGTNGGNEHSSLTSPPSISDDGRFVAFDSEASDLVANDTNGGGPFGTDVFVRDLQNDSTTLATINSAGTGSGNLNSFASSARISGNGRFVVFGSRATDLVTGITDSNGLTDIFIRDLVAGTTSIVTINVAGNAAGNDLSEFPAISDDGRFVSFTSRAGNLVPVDTNNGLGAGISDVFVRDMQTGVTELVSINSAGTDSGNSSSPGLSEISADGRYVLFTTAATNLTNIGDFNNNPDLLQRDLQTDSTTLISIDRFGNAGSSNTTGFSLSNNNEVIAFESQSGLLTTNDGNGSTDVFVLAPPPPGLTVSDVTVTEGDSGTIDAVFTVTLTDGPASGNVTATAITFTDTASFPEDFQVVFQGLTFTPGETTKLVTVPINGDVIFEGTERFTLELRDVVGAAVPDGVGVGTIFDNEQQPTLSINDISVTEGDSGTTDAVFTVTLSGPSKFSVGVGFTLANGTAVESEDFGGVGGGLLIFSGLTSTTVTVPIIGDTITEPNETFFVNLAQPSNATILDNQGVGTIIDDESASEAPTVQFSARFQSVPEGSGSIVVNVTRSGNLSALASVDYATSPNNASDRGDYTSALGTLNFASGESSKSITVFITNDVFVEGNENFLVRLSNPTGGASLGFPVEAIIHIVDNDTSAPQSNPIDDAAFFVRQHYIDFLNREPDAGGLAFWTNEITQCFPDPTCREIKRINVSAAFFLSIEFENTGYLVYRMFKTAYGDTTSPNVAIPVPIIRFNEFLPDAQRIGQGVQVGIGPWEAQLEANKNAYAREFVVRQRFLTEYPLTMTPAQFVDKLNLNAGGVLSQSERDELIAALSIPGDITFARAMVLRKVAEDADLRQRETTRAFVLMQYYGYLRRNPDDPQDTDFRGWEFWLNKLNQFNGNFVQAEMVKAFIDSIEYRQRFGP